LTDSEIPRSHPLFTLRPPGARVLPEAALAAVRAYRANEPNAAAAVLGAFAGLLGYLAQRWGALSLDVAYSAAMATALDVCADRAVPLDYDILVGRLNTAVTGAVQRARLDESGAMVPPRVARVSVRAARARLRDQSVLLPFEQLACTPKGDVTARELELAVAAGPFALGDYALDHVEGVFSTPEHEVEERSEATADRLRTALETLSKGDQWILASIFGLSGESFTAKELAAVEGVSVNAMWRRITAAKARLRVAIETLQATPAQQAPYCHLDPASFRARAMYWAERDTWLPKHVAAVADALAAEAARHGWDLATVILMARRVAEYRTGTREGDFGAALVDAARARCTLTGARPAAPLPEARRASRSGALAEAKA
jgi:DNA-directed RNA polymerase specialized sigma24 family protein